MLVLAGTAAGCDKKESAPAAKPTSTAAAAPATAAAADTASAEPAEKKKKKKKAGHKPADAKKVAEKHPDSDKDNTIDDKAGKVDKDIFESKLKKKRQGGPQNQCKGAPDLAGICAGDVMAFCAGEEAYYVDCNQFEIDAGFASGTCIQVGMNPDCYGATPSDKVDAEPEYQVYCDPDENTCVDSDGYSWHDESAGDDG